ncbi:hypothetical protein [Demequina sp. NBRC 110055]|uniref:hypothetical protein n=1 Tax=Demequina sp. NBRC 110055 TaxID=1570344 RepID=UPI000A008721|nr:hypothetical protein [Demequina sp. NBRC 110055]
MIRPQDATTNDGTTPAVPGDPALDEDLDRDDEDTVILPRRDPADEPVEPPRDDDPDPFIDDEADAVTEADAVAEPAAPARPKAAEVTAEGDIPLGGLARYTPTGSIPIVGEANPITGAMPVIGPVYPPKSRRPWIIATSVLALALIGAGYLGWRMWQINEEWQAYADDVTSANYDLGEQIAGVQQNLTEKQQEVDLLSQQLATSNDRLTDVSAEKAAALDSQELTSQVITTLEETLSLGQAATATLNSCIDGLEQLTAYLQAPEDEYEPEQITEYASNVSDLCDNADAATARFQGALTE